MKKHKELPEYKLSERLKYLRESRQWTQMEFSKHAKVSQSTIAHIEKGLKDPSVDTLRKIAIALDVDIATIFASKEVHVFDIPRLRRKYKKSEDLTDAMHAALWKVVQFARDIKYLK